MRTVVFYGAISLDGFLSTKNDSLQWLFDTQLDDDYDIQAFENTIDTVVMGNTTYLETLKLSGNKNIFPNKEKIVFSHQYTGAILEGHYVSGNPENIIKNLQTHSGKSIWIVGGGAIFTQLLKANLIDEFWIQIAPVVLGTGKRLFEENEYKTRLNLVSTTTIGELTQLHLKK